MRNNVPHAQAHVTQKKAGIDQRAPREPLAPSDSSYSACESGVRTECSPWSMRAPLCAIGLANARRRACAQQCEAGQCGERRRHGPVELVTAEVPAKMQPGTERPPSAFAVRVHSVRHRASQRAKAGMRTGI
jgi:hypothetical protein